MGISRKNGHVYLNFTVTTEDALYSELELQKLHRHLYHPSARNLFEVLRRADPRKLDCETLRVLESINKACHMCQKYSCAPIRFQIRTSDDVVFNRELRLDLMLLDQRDPVLHVFDAGTTYQAAMFLDGEGFAPVWNAFVKCWTRRYVGDPEYVTVDSGSVFNSEAFVQTCAAHEIKMRTTAVESHSTIGVGERYHAPLRRIYRKLRDENPDVQKEVLLQCAVFAMNSTLGPDGLVPMLLVYGQLPRVPSLASTPILTVKQRISLMATARAEYEQWVAQQRVAIGLSKKPPDVVDRMFAAGEHVYVYRERQRAWTGPDKIVC
jgi:hypothetical protein